MCLGNEPGHAEVEQLVEDAEKYTLANHLFWVLWGIISVSFIDFQTEKRFFFFVFQMGP